MKNFLLRKDGGGMFEKIAEQLLEVADSKKAEKMAAYMRNQFTFLGISAADRKLICKDFYKEIKGQAIGWSLRDYSKVNSEWVKKFINEHREGLSALSIREASKYL